MALRRQDNAAISFRKKGLRSSGDLFLHLGPRTTWHLGVVTQAQFEDTCAYQRRRPVHVATIDDRRYWYFQDRFYWENDGLDESGVYALLVTRHQREVQRVQRAKEIVATGGRPRSNARPTIPEDVKHLVWVRDGGACRLCGATSELQFDHVIPLALGGASTADNLQILCGACNRRKSASIGVPDAGGYFPW